MDNLSSWSYSRLSIFEQCKLRAKLQWLDKIPDPNPKTAADRGSAIHEAGESFVRGDKEFVSELRKFEDEFRKLRRIFDNAPDDIALEEEWGYDTNWSTTDWFEAWLRVKCDAVVWLSPTEVVVIDYKTGKRFGNEVKHGEQTMLYAAAVAARFPNAEIIHTELWYLDVDELAHTRYTRNQALQALARFDKRGTAVTTEEEFKANPNQYSCRWCPYKPSGTGHCEVGV